MLGYDREQFTGKPLWIVRDSAHVVGHVDFDEGFDSAMEFATNFVGQFRGDFRRRKVAQAMDIEQTEVFAPKIEVMRLSNRVDICDQFVDGSVTHTDYVAVPRKQSTTDELQCASREVAKVHYGIACAR